MPGLQAQAVVVGGGATGVAVLRDLARRGISGLLLERSDLGTGTSGRWHGLVHSGARYAVTDPPAATECARENAVLRRIAAHCLEDTGGLFVRLRGDDEGYAAAFRAGCRDAGVEVERVAAGAARRREPGLSPQVAEAFAVPDATLDGWAFLRAMATDAREHGAELLTRHEVVGLERAGDRVTAVRARAPDGTEHAIGCDWVLNAAGPWAGRVAALAGVQLRLGLGRGVMVVLASRHVRGVVNRCRAPGDGDIVVPVHEVAVLGTTDVPVTDPEDARVDPAEVDAVLAGCAELVPAVRTARALRAFAGVRALYGVAGSGAASRSFAVLEHDRRGEAENLLSIVGGKLTTSRLMAERLVDALAARLGVSAPCTTAEAPLPGAARGPHLLAGPLRDVERDAAFGDLVCECELVTVARVEAALEAGAAGLDDLRRATRLGFGPCQGAFCGLRAAGMLAARDGARAPAKQPRADDPLLGLRGLLQERWAGQRPVLSGDQARQALLNRAIYAGTLALGPGAQR